MADGEYGRPADGEVRPIAARLGVAGGMDTVQRLAKRHGSRQIADVLRI
jgi:hypothetical protein